MAFGIPYCGSKNIYAKKICDALPNGERLVDLFAGGGAITDCAMKKFNKWKKFLINDINPEPINLYVNCLAGKNPVSYNWVSREEFKKADWASRLVWSFANGLRTYIYGVKNENKLHSIWYDEVVNSWDYVVSNVLVDRKLWYLKNIKSRGVRMLHLERLHRLDCLKCLDCLERLEKSNISYLEYNHEEGDVVYCDIPYEDTKCDQYATPFNHEEFWNWARSRPYDVYVSERTIPNDATIILAKDVPNRLASGTKGYRTDYLVKI
jgi:site-specific DNA-adenine methylase